MAAADSRAPQQITVGDFTYDCDQAGNIRRWLCDCSESAFYGPGCDHEQLLGEKEIPDQVRKHFHHN